MITSQSSMVEALIMRERGMNKRSIACGTCIFLITLAANSSSAAQQNIPRKILCTPTEYNKVGIENLSGSKPEIQVFEYGGKVKTEKIKDNTHYTYGDEGEVFFKLKEKYSFSKELTKNNNDLFILQKTGWHEDSGKIIVAGDMEHGYFHIDLKKGRYYGYTHDWESISTFSGTCTTTD